MRVAPVVVLVVVLVACGGATHAADKPKPPPYAMLFERGRAWAEGIEVITGHVEPGGYVADETKNDVVRCRVVEVRATAEARTSTVTCSPPYAGLLVTGDWVATPAGLVHPPVEPNAEEIAGHAQAATSREAFTFEHAWCVRETAVSERDHHELALCFDGKGVSGGGELVIGDEKWHLARFGKAPVIRDPSLVMAK